MKTQSRLIPVSYYDPKTEVRLSVYADTIVYESEHNQKTLRAIRFGGYPEMVAAMADAVYGGAGIDAEVDGRVLHILSQVKRYRRQISRDGIYAEATLLSLDDEQGFEMEGSEAAGQETVNRPPRKCCIFCPKDDRDKLFEEIDRKTAVPLISEFKDYLLNELQSQGILKKMNVHSVKEQMDAWVLRCTSGDKNIVKLVEDGLNSGAISIPGAGKSEDSFAEINSVTGYLNAFGVTVAGRIQNQFQPLFDPASEPLSPEILSVNDCIRRHAGYSLYDAQLAVAESVKRQLQKHKCAFIVAECGSGKTKIGAAAMWAAQGLQGRKKTFNAVLCPSHVSKKWVREIGETLPDTVGVVVKSISELNRLYRHYKMGDKSVYAVISKERARDGYMKRPAVIWNKRRKAFLCPDCMAVIEMPVSDDGVRYLDKADQFWFRTEHRKNRKCPHCKAALWTAVNPAHSSDWVKIGVYGWIFRHKADEHLKKCKDEGICERLMTIAQNPNGHYPTVGACRRYPLSSYIKRYFRSRLDGAIFDELHQYNNASGQGDAMGEIYNAARKAIGMTATLVNGYSSGIFHLLYRIVPYLMLKDGKKYTAPKDFDTEYGVVENIYEVKNADYASNRRNQKVKRRTRQLPGVSPLVYSRFLLEQTAFLSLSDMGKELPDYEEIPVPLSLDEAAKAEYETIEKALTEVLRSDKSVAKKILSAYLNLLTVFPDQPYDQPEVLHPVSKEPIVSPKNITDADTLGAKEEKVLEIVRRKIENGERVLIYTSWTRIDSQQKLFKLLTENGYRTDILTDKICPEKREEWVAKRVNKGLQVLITNPSLVETGLDLNAFTTLIFFSMGYNLFTLRQSSRRSWRINQTAPRIEVYLLYYRNTIQQKAMKLMASKLAVAGIIEGNFTDEGLAAMSDVRDMTSQLAKELMLGIRDNVEDIAASFKRMAVINSNRSLKADVQPAAVQFEQAPTTVSESTGSVLAPRLELLQQIIAKAAEITKHKYRKKQMRDENQLSLFEDVA